MGFPLGYTELHFPKLLLHVLSLLSFIKKLISTILTLLGLPHFLEPESPYPTRPAFPYPTRPDPNLGFSRKLISTLLTLLGLPHSLEPEFPSPTRPDPNLGFTRKLISTLLTLLGHPHFLEPDPTRPEFPDPTQLCSVSALIIRELLPVVKLVEIEDPPENCAVCLYEFELEDEIRRLMNCCHVFHRRCVDRWMDHDQMTCPLCRRGFVPEGMMGIFNEKLWLACGFYENYSYQSSGS